MGSPYQIRFWKGEKRLDFYMRTLPAVNLRHMLKHRGEICIFGPGVKVTWFKNGEGKLAKKFYLMISRAYQAGEEKYRYQLPWVAKEIRSVLKRCK